jgi:hypothetical protein
MVCMAFACAEEELVTIRNNPEAPVLLSPTSGATLTLDPEQSDEMIQFEFTPADFGFQAAVTYTVQMALKGKCLRCGDQYQFTGKYQCGSIQRKVNPKGIKPR